MKVLVVHNAGRSDQPSGELTVVKREVSGLRKKGIQVKTYIARNDGMGRIGSLKSIAAGVNLFWSYSVFKTMKDLIDCFRPDIVHFHTILPLFTASAVDACRARNVPVIQTLHNYRWFCVEGGLYRDGVYCEECLHNGSYKGIACRCSKNSFLISSLLALNNLVHIRTKNLVKKVDRFISVSNFVKEKHVEAGFPEEKIEVKYHGIDLEEWNSAESGMSAKSGVAFVGRLSSSKGTEIVKRLVREMPDIPFNIIGDGTELSSMKQHFEDNGLENVMCHGRVPPSVVMEIVSRSACVVIPSTCAETFSLVAVEAMASKTPVVASKIGGMREIVEKSGAGITVNPDNLKGFISSIRKIVESRKLVNDFGQAGREFVRCNLTLDRSVAELITIYKRVIGQKE